MLTGEVQNSETSYEESGRRGLAARRSDVGRTLTYAHEPGSSGYDIVVEEDEDEGRQEEGEEGDGEEGEEEEEEEEGEDEEMDVDGEDEEGYESEDEYVENEGEQGSALYLRSPRGSLYETHVSSGEATGLEEEAGTDESIEWSQSLDLNGEESSEEEERPYQRHDQLVRRRIRRRVKVGG